MGTKISPYKKQGSMRVENLTIDIYPFKFAFLYKKIKSKKKKKLIGEINCSMKTTPILSFMKI